MMSGQTMEMPDTWRLNGASYEVFTDPAKLVVDTLKSVAKERPKILYLTNSFVQAMDNSHGKIWDESFIENHVFDPELYFMLLPSGVQYLFKCNGGSYLNAGVFGVKMIGNSVMALVYGANGDSGVNGFIEKAAPGKSSYINFGFNFMAFQKYAPRLEKNLPPKAKLKDFHCRYFNESGVDIKIYDLNYFTKSVQANPFMVRGHWKLQPCGKRWSDRKLIWIDPFIKQGYTKGAYMDEE